MLLNLIQKISKVTSDINFRPKLASWENTLSTAQLFEDQLPDWQIDKGVRSNILLFSKANGEYLRVGFDSFAYVNESNADLSKFKTFLKTISEKFKENDIVLFKSIECRNLKFFEADIKYEELGDFLFEKFYSSHEEIKHISVDTVKDTAFSLDGEKNGFLNHCNFGPMRKQQLLDMYKPAFEFDISQIDEEKTYLYLDVKVHLLEPKFDDLKGAARLVEEVETEAKRISDAYLNLIKKIN